MLLKKLLLRIHTYDDSYWYEEATLLIVINFAKVHRRIFFVKI
jgi:hypothetical protein